jgi:hypothetical protein
MGVHVCWLVLWCLMPLSTIFQLYVAVRFIGGGNLRTTDPPHVADKLYHIMLFTSPWVGFELTISVVIGTDCIGGCKSNHHTITATDLQLPVQSVHITTKVVSSNPVHVEVYLIQHNAITFINDLQQVSGFLHQ